MRILTKALGAAAAIAITTGVATSANAAILMFPFAGFSVHAPLVYTGNVPGADTGSLDITNGATVFSFDQIATGGPGVGIGENAKITFHARTNQLATGGAVAGAIVEQKGYHGSFNIIYAGSGATPLPGCTGSCLNLLSGTFTGASLLGHQDTNHADISAGTALVFQTLVMTSDFYDFSDSASQSFSITFNPVNPALHRNANGLIRNFRANAAGVAGVGTYVPEPATWALMITGFGGVGMMLRSRRRQAAAV